MNLLLSRRSRQRERLNASVLSIVCLFVCLLVCLTPKCKNRRFSRKVGNLELWSLMTTYRKSYLGFQRTHYWTLKSKMSEIRHLENRHYVRPIFFCRGWSDLDKISRLVQNDMSTAVIWSKSKPEVEFQCGGRLANSVACHPRATYHIAGCCHLVNSLS